MIVAKPSSERAVSQALAEMFDGGAKEDVAPTPAVDSTVDALDPYSQPAESVAPKAAKEEADDIDALLNMI